MMRQESEKLGVMQSRDRLENEIHENMRQLKVPQSLGLNYITQEINYVCCTKYAYTVVVCPFVYCFVNAAASSCCYATLPQSQRVA